MAGRKRLRVWVGPLLLALAPGGCELLPRYAGTSTPIRRTELVPPKVPVEAATGPVLEPPPGMTPVTGQKPAEPVNVSEVPPVVDPTDPKAPRDLTRVASVMYVSPTYQEPGTTPEVEQAPAPKSEQLPPKTPNELPKPEQLPPKTPNPAPGTAGKPGVPTKTGPGCPPGTNAAGAPVPPAPDTHLRKGPTAEGCILGLQPGDSLAERATAMTLKFNTAEAERKALEARAKALLEQLELREKALRDGSAEVQNAAEEIQKTRAQVEAYKRELEDSHAKLRMSYKEQIETLNLTIRVLERLLKDTTPAAPEDR